MVIWLPSEWFLLYLVYREISLVSAGQGGGAVQNQDGKSAFAETQIIEPSVTPEEDERNERTAQGMKLLLAARDRALTLTEQRVFISVFY